MISRAFPSHKVNKNTLLYFIKLLQTALFKFIPESRTDILGRVIILGKFGGKRAIFKEAAISKSYFFDVKLSHFKI